LSGGHKQIDGGKDRKETTMKKRHGVFFGFAVLLITAIFTLAGCDTDGSSNDGFAPSLGNITSDGKVTDVAASGVGINYTADFPHFYDDDYNKTLLSDVIPNSSVKITNGKLTIRLGTPKVEVLGSLSTYVGSTGTVSNDVKIYTLDHFVSNDDSRLLTFQKSDAVVVLFFYADKDATATGIATLGTITYSLNLTLKKGWNMVIWEASDGNGNDKMTSGTPDNNFKWTAADLGQNP
jgi:hypothetical protein